MSEQNLASIPGIGVDLCKVSRLAGRLEDRAFLEMVFSPAERELLSGLSGQRRAQTAAANFAAKEAFLKAAGTGLTGFPLDELAVLRHESGMPYFALSGQAAAWAASHRLVPRVSLTHEDGLACAFVLLAPEGSAG